MDIVRRAYAIKEITREARERGQKVGLVPTMGYLHDGHFSLVRRVKERSDIVIVSIFVNPTQFGENEDFDQYPRDLTRDADLCIAEGVDYIFAPETEEIYPPGNRTFVEVEGLSKVLEGESRPTHFRGVTTVVLKLLEIVDPHVAAFGQKDAQQAVIIQRMVRDLMLDVEIQIVPTVRDEDGVALSSRNAYLSPEQRRAARAIPKALQATEKAVADGEENAAEVVKVALDILTAESLLKVDYVALVDGDNLQPLETVEGRMLLALAVWVGETRLIDNVRLNA
ncbi:MAG: pantoate--beta-alanine ligase [Acidobacteriota bacterium]|nr:pantoate--beta-alanine ligase [Acidobacteriota bacterium]